jgi:alpha-galactosidase
LPIRLLLVLVLASLSATRCFAQEAISYQSDRRVWTLTAGEATYSFGVNETGELQSLYWGARISDQRDIPTAASLEGWASFDLPSTRTPQEYPGWGAALYVEPAVKVKFPDGNRSLALHYVSHSIRGNDLEVVLQDIKAPIFVHLFYRVYPGQGVMARWSKIENRGTTPITIDQAASAALSLPVGDDYRLSWLTGRWAGEWQLHSAPIETGTNVIESRRGSTSHQANPWFSIARPSETTEESGPVWFGELGWSGSWRLTVEKTSFHQVRVTGGFNSFDFSYPLAPGQSLETPPFYAGFTGKGEGEASRILHRFQQAVILPGGPHPKVRPVLYNSWEATEFNVNQSGQESLADKAAQLGAERFVMDDGWFGQRSDDHRGLGDWYVNPQKFPNGLKHLIDHVHGLGMDFGIWVEPEMVNPDSDLYRQHPDWAMNFPDRPRTEGRNQLMLNLARPDVKEYIFGFLDKLVSENDVAFLKWDYNRNWSEPGWDQVPLEQQQTIYVTYVRNLYEILDRLRAKHPKLEIESCSGGGGRVDLGIMQRTEQVWTSDNTDALDRLTLQDGFTHAYTPGVMMAWVTDVPNFLDKRTIPTRFRFLVAMNGSLGIGVNLNKWSADEMKEGTKFVAYYKQIRETVQHGSLYRLLPPENSETSATEYVSADGKQAVVFAFLHSEKFGSPFPVLRLRGLSPTARYRIKVLDPDTSKLPREANGDTLMNMGISVALDGDYAATSVLLERLD